MYQHCPDNSCTIYLCHQQVSIQNSDYCTPRDELAPGTPGQGFVAYGLSGMDCMEEGTVAPLSFPTTLECYQYCSTSSGLSPPWYFRLRTFSSGATECSCVGDTCLIAPTNGSPSSRRELRYLRDLQSTDAVTDTTVYRADQAASPPSEPQPTASPTVSPTVAANTTTMLLVDQGPNKAILNVQQLALGYHSFLGLLPHEQQGAYMRKPGERIR